ncbi:uncharacterized protein [Eurosta solidaginis]|uniref:uncharacterized protein isoform X2 n=1 Tax=Eurosta solidaginis TaxID=178769 RepID=UPI0035309D24
MVTRHFAFADDDNCCKRSSSYQNNNNKPKNLVFPSNNKQRIQIFNEKRAKNIPNCEMENPFKLSIFHVTLIGFVLFSVVAQMFVAVQGAAVYSNINFLTNPNFEQICNPQQEHYIESDGKESSLILEFSPGVLAEKRKLCTRILSAPTNYGFIVRLILPKIRRNRHGVTVASSPSAESAIGLAATTVITSTTTTTVPATAVNESATQSVADINVAKRKGAPILSKRTSLIDKHNTTASKQTKSSRSCPLSVFSSLDFHTPQWRLDPCALEDTAPEMEDPVRLFHGRVRIVWEHGHHALHSKLMVTALGKGEQCRSENKHQCLKIGDEPILCISKELVCDGIRHCPISNEYDSDEDYEMCWRRRRFGEPIPPAMETDIFEHFALEVFRNLFAFDVPSYGETTTVGGSALDPTAMVDDVNGSNGVVNSTTLRKMYTKHMDPKMIDEGKVGNSNGTAIEQADNTTGSFFGHHRRNSTRSGLNSDLSKYGPWGYLMLGMLLCGGALLICGLWASASQHAANNEREATIQVSGAGSGNDLQSTNVQPPNYEELDPPPAYSVLFPNQKAASSTTLSSLGAAALMPPTIAVVAVSAPNGTAVMSPVVAAASASSTSVTVPATPPTTTMAAAAAAAAAAASSISRLNMENVACSSHQAH